MQIFDNKQTRDKMQRMLIEAKEMMEEGTEN